MRFYTVKIARLYSPQIILWKLYRIVDIRTQSVNVVLVSNRQKKNYNIPTLICEFCI